MSEKPYIIAEIASAHEGKISILRKLIGQVINSNADAIKFQIFNRDYLISKNNSLYDEFGKIEFSQEEWKEILSEVSKLSIDIIIEAYDIESIKLLENIEVKIDFKSPASNINNRDYLFHLCKRAKKIYLSVGGATVDEVEIAINYIKKLKFGNEIVLVCGFQNFPTNIEDSNIAQINYLYKKFNLEIAYADHTSADDIQMRDQIPFMALAAGANIIEKHITIDRSQKGRDYYSSLNPDEFKIFVRNIKKLYAALGNPKHMGKTSAEVKYRQFSKRYAVAKEFIPKGTKCKKELFNFKRTGQIGITENEIQNFLNKEIIKDLKTEDQLNEDQLV